MFMKFKYLLLALLLTSCHSHTKEDNYINYEYFQNCVNENQRLADIEWRECKENGGACGTGMTIIRQCDSRECKTFFPND